jgi:heterotetrameric sarcosine oxidase gamma subunit
VADAGLHQVSSMAPGHYGAEGTGCRIHLATLRAVWNVQGDPTRTSVVADVQQLFRIALPLDPNTTRRSGDDALLALWVGPRSWLLIEGGASDRAAAPVDFDARRDALNADGGALFDVSASRIAFTIRGARAVDVLAASCPLDFDSRFFAPGACAQSVLGRSSALFYRHAVPPGFTVMVARSVAADAWRALCGAAAVWGYEVEAPAAFDVD